MQQKKQKDKKELVLEMALERAKNNPKTEKVYYMSKRVIHLKNHQKENKKDKHSLYGLIKLHKRIIKECKYLKRKGIDFTDLIKSI